MTKKICSIKSCEKTHKALGYCRQHYDRYRRHGHTQALRCVNKGMTCLVCPEPAAKKLLCIHHYDVQDYRRENNRKRTQRHYRENKAYYKAKKERRKHRAKQATPLWLTKEHWAEMNKIYRECPKDMEVDHIVPLNGKTVSGLHVPWNLQYLTPKENRVKSNKLLKEII